MREPVAWHDNDAFWDAWRRWSFGSDQWDGAPTEVDKILDLVRPHPGAAALDLCCGPGRHSLELARRGFRVTGVDRTRSYIDEARERAAAEGLDLEFVASDMREFLRPGAFDLAVNLFTAFGYFEDEDDNRSVLANLFGSLKPGGTLVIEIMSKEILARVFQARDWSEKNGVLHLRETRVLRNWSWIENRWIYIDGVNRHEFHVSHWLYSARELACLLADAGFSHTTTYGSLDGTPYDENAKRLVMVAHKAAA